MSPRQVLLSLATVLVVVGMVLGLKSVTTDDISCGSVFSPSSAEAELADSGEEIAGTLEGADPDTDGISNRAACDSAVSDAKPFTYGALGLGVLATIAGIAASPNKPTNPDGTAKPSVWR